MIIKYIIYFIISSLTAFVSLLMFNKILYAVIVLIVNLVFFIMCDYLIIKKKKSKRAKENDLINFIHDFYIGYIKNISIKEGLDFATLKTSYKVVEQIKLLDEYDDYQKLEKLASYFNNEKYVLFIKSININKKVISPSLKHLVSENSMEIKKNKDINKYLDKSIIEYVVLWLVAFLLFITVRLVLDNQYKTICSSVFYTIGVSVFFLIFLFSNYCFILSYSRIKK